MKDFGDILHRVDVKVIELNVASKAEGFQQAVEDKYDVERGQVLGNVEEE